MRAVVQRVKEAYISIDGHITASIGKGMVALLGIEKGDGVADTDYIIRKLTGLRIFPDKDGPDENGKMTLDVGEIDGSILVVSQFTLLADTRKGRRPSFDRAEDPEKARAIYEDFMGKIRSTGATVAEGEFQAMMEVSLVNDGPVTILIDSRKGG